VSGCIGNEMKRAVRSLSRAQGFVLTIVITLGLLLGAIICIFSLNWLLLVKPLPYPEQHRLVYVKGQSLKDKVVVRDDSHIYPVLTEIYQDAENFDSVALISYNDNIIANLPDTPRMDMTYVSPEYFTLLDMPVVLGRPFSVVEGVGDNRPVAVISYKTWQHYFKGSKDVLGKKILIGITRFTIVGVAAENFEEPELHGNTWNTQVWLPWDYNEIKANSKRENNWSKLADHTKLIGRLKELSVDSNHLAIISQKLTSQMAEKHRRNNDEVVSRKFSIALEVQILDKRILGDSHTTALLMFVGVFMLLCIAGTNVTNLFFARSAQMQRALAIRSALGASPMHLFKVMLAETIIIMSLAALLAGFVAMPGMKLLIELSKDHFPRVHTLHFGWVEAIFLLVSTVLLAILFAWLVCKQINYRKLVNSLQSGGKGGGLQVAKKNRYTIILIQVALAGVLLTSTLTLLSQSLVLWLTPQSVETQGRYLLRANVRLGGDENRLHGDALKEMIDQLPYDASIEQVSHSNTWPYWGHNMLLSDKLGSGDTFSLSGSGIDENWLSFYNVQLLRGRNFTRAELDDGARVLLVNQSAANLIATDAHVVGKRLHWHGSDKLYTVVGVIEDIALPGVNVEPQIHYPSSSYDNNIAIKMVAGQTLEREKLSKLLDDINGRLYVSRLIDCDELYRSQLARDRLIVGISFAISSLTLFIVGIGLYGILSYQVQLCRSELGIRLAIGAKPNDIFRFVIIDTLKPASIGLATSLLIGAGIIRFYRHEISALISGGETAWVFPALISLSFILSVIFLACYLPLRYVVNQPPIYSLRENIIQ
jgi:putative ABC transport system permease protein